MNKDTRGKEDETIMPDGRPLFAWRNEIEMNRSERRHIEEDRQYINTMFSILGIYEIEKTNDPSTGDILIRVKSRDLVNAYRPENALKTAEITKL